MSERFWQILFIIGGFAWLGMLFAALTGLTPVWWFAVIALPISVAMWVRVVWLEFIKRGDKQ